MGLPLLYRAQGWLADNFRWAQYPREQLLPRVPAPSVPWEQRALLAMLGVVLILIAAVLAFFVSMLFWAMFTA